jgi:hypothetical protein
MHLKKTAPSLGMQDAHWLGVGQVGRPEFAEGADMQMQSH